MENFMNQLRKYQWLQALVYMLVGIFLLIRPMAFFKGVTYLIGGYFIVMGLIGIFQRPQDTTAARRVSASEVIMIIIGLCIILFTGTLISLVNVLFGIFILANGISKLLSGLDLRKQVINAGMSLIIYGVLLVIVGLVIIINPFSTLLFLFQMIGLVLLLMGIFDLVGYFGFKKYF
ncbi:DUF308 domain-containing protein [Enterococcus nangangensis]|uniref:DUF308 domain-containing protein n=1 Tax=Enterococcus nangangensis TaxID=2559926 RepID=UPI00148555A4|nr:DUF308 domain-containing protein [Enterococcus nangangensis]